MDTTIYKSIAIRMIADGLSYYAKMLKSGASMDDTGMINDDVIDEGIDGIAQMIEMLEDLGVKIERKE